MHPILFQFGSFTLYTYGFFIAVGTLLGGLFMGWQGRKRYGMTFEQANNLILLLLIAGVVGGKLFVIFENPSFYLAHPSALASKNGFVFYGSLLTAVPLMLWFFKKRRLPVLGMLDVMAMVTCIVHGFGRIGCFNAGCCYGLPTTSPLGVTFTDSVCQAQPLHTPLHPTQLYEAGLIFFILVVLYFLNRAKKFQGQVFLTYLVLYGVGRSILETFRGDLQRGFVIDGILSNSQLISLLVIATALYYYVKLRRKAIFPLSKNNHHGK